MNQDKWILSNYTKIHSSILSFFITIIILVSILLHLLSSSILKLRVLDAKQAPKPSQNQAMK